MLFAIIDILKGADFMVYPLALFSVVVVFIVCERGYALRNNAIAPDELVDAILEKRPVSGGKHSVLARIIDYADNHPDDPEATRAYARWELTQMERGLSYLDVAYAGAPLLGLIGTVLAMIKLFAATTGTNGLPDPVAFNNGVSLALSATLLGIAVAVPALIASGIFTRRIEKHAANIELLLERVFVRGRAKKASASN